jgi:hypothetical protein
VGYFGGKAAAHVLAQAGIAGLVVMVLTAAGAWVFVRRRERRRERDPA